MISINETDSLDILVTVTKSGDGAALDLTGTSIVALADFGALKKTGSVVVTNAAQGEFLVSFDAATFKDNLGVYRFQARVTKGTDVQTVIDTIFEVTESIEL